MSCYVQISSTVSSIKMSTFNFTYTSNCLPELQMLLSGICQCSHLTIVGCEVIVGANDHIVIVNEVRAKAVCK